MAPQLLPAGRRDGDPWSETLYEFLVLKGNRSGSRRTVQSYGALLWPLFTGLGKTPAELTLDDAIAWAYRIGASGRAPSRTTIAARLACLSSYLHFLVRTRRITVNVCEEIDRPKPEPSRPRGFSADQVHSLLAVVPDTVRGRRDRALLLTFVLTGRRRAEVIGLKAGDITLEDSVAFYSYRGKGGKTGRRELPRPAYEAIVATLADDGRKLATMAPEESLWRISSGTFYGRFRRYLAAAGLAPTGLHVLRHSAAKLRRDAGESVEAVSQWMDHSSLQVTSVYLRRLEGIEDLAWRQVASAIGVVSGP
jgi:integrase